MFDILKNTIYSIYAGIDDGWQYPHHINYNQHDLYVNIMHVAQVSRLAYEVYKSGGHLSYREVRPFSAKPSSIPAWSPTESYRDSFKNKDQN